MRDYDRDYEDDVETIVLRRARHIVASARKAHKCENCDRPIRIGDPYVKHTDIVMIDGDFCEFTRKWHTQCPDPHDQLTIRDE